MNQKHRLKSQLKDLKKEDFTKSEIITELTSTMELLQKTISSASPLQSVPHVVNPSLPVTPPYTPTSSFISLPSEAVQTPNVSPTSSSSSLATTGSISSTQANAVATTTPTPLTATPSPISSLSAQLKAANQSLTAMPSVLPLGGAALACFKQQSGEQFFFFFFF